MPEQNYANHAYRPMLFNIAVVLWAAAVTAVLMRSPGRWITMASELTVLAILAVLIWTTRAYTVRLQDRIILIEMKVRAAETLPAGQDAKLAQLTKSQIIALRFASDAELSDLLDRAVRDKLSSKEIKMAIKQWKPDLLRTLGRQMGEEAQGPSPKPQDRKRPVPVTPDEQQEVRRLIEAHERTLHVCRVCAETTRDLAWEVKRGGVPSPESLSATITEVERVLEDLGRVEMIIAGMKSALW